ncbi:hypothetical protein [Paraburkholderia lacunae]|uniref:hypothetical protein n=1 Tax=Paraburkholderia lacunae TaxID=2211104 RepID=UPI0014021C4A|nr:hypothetical protein [Paraburkholderia lacunae]
MPTSAFRLFAFVGLFAATALLGACGNSVDPPKAACGNATVTDARMSCPPGFVPPAS